MMECQRSIRSLGHTKEPWLLNSALCSRLLCGDFYWHTQPSMQAKMNNPIVWQGPGQKLPGGTLSLLGPGLQHFWHPKDWESLPGLFLNNQLLPRYQGAAGQLAIWDPIPSLPCLSASITFKLSLQVSKLKSRGLGATLSARHIPTWRFSFLPDPVFTRLFLSLKAARPRAARGPGTVAGWGPVDLN